MQSGKASSYPHFLWISPCINVVVPYATRTFAERYKFEQLPTKSLHLDFTQTVTPRLLGTLPLSERE
jgi:hypothetical protein